MKEKDFAKLNDLDIIQYKGKSPWIKKKLGDSPIILQRNPVRRLGVSFFHPRWYELSFHFQGERNLHKLRVYNPSAWKLIKKVSRKEREYKRLKELEEGMPVLLDDIINNCTLDMKEIFVEAADLIKDNLADLPPDVAMKFILSIKGEKAKWFRLLDKKWEDIEKKLLSGI